MSLELEMSRIFEAGLKKIIAREKAEDDYLNFKYYQHFTEPHRARAQDIIKDAMKEGPEDFLTLACAYDSQERKKRPAQKEIDQASANLIALQINPSEAKKGWWGH